MSLTSCLFVAGTLPTSRELLSRDLVHLIDNNFWNLGFKNDETQAEKVIVIIQIISQL